MNSIKTWFESQVVIDKPEGLDLVDFNNTRHAAYSGDLGGFCCQY